MFLVAVLAVAIATFGPVFLTAWLNTRQPPRAPSLPQPHHVRRIDQDPAA